MSNIPLWLKWLIFFGIALLLFLIIWFILHIKVLPTKLHTNRKDCTMIYDGENKTQTDNFDATLQSGTVQLKSQHGTKTFGIAMDVVPGPESYLYKGHARRTAEVKPETVRIFGQGKITSALIGSVMYTADEKGKLQPKLAKQQPFLLRDGMFVKFSGNVRDAGIDKEFDTRIKLDFKKKK